MYILGTLIFEDYTFFMYILKRDFLVYMLIYFYYKFL